MIDKPIDLARAVNYWFAIKKMNYLIEDKQNQMIKHYSDYTL